MLCWDTESVLAAAMLSVQDASNAMLVYEYSSYGFALDLSGRTEEDMLVAYRSQASARIKELMPDYLETAYAERYSSAEVKADVENMLRDLIATFRQRIADLDWMSDATKEKAYKRL